jgi:hypothetical protein
MTKPKQKKIVPCQVCGNPFLASRSSNVICSKVCNSRNWIANNREKHNERCRQTQRRLYGIQARPETNIDCQRCGASFLPDRATQKYCSVQCAQQARYAENPEPYLEKSRRIRLSHLEESREKDRVQYHSTKNRRSLQRLRMRQAMPWVPLLNSAKARANKHGLPFDLDLEWMKSRWTGRCELTGIPFVSGSGRGKSGILSPTIDKIIPALGYVRTNCRIILKSVNLFKLNGTDEQMYRTAEALLAMRLTTAPHKDQSGSQEVSISDT